jgi:homoserine O-acetyltransferase
MNAARENVALVCHALSGSAQVAEWRPAIFASPSIIDSGTTAVLGIYVPGSCYRSTGPRSINPATGRRYAGAFPLVQIGDIVRALGLLLDALAIPRLQLARCVYREMVSDHGHDAFLAEPEALLNLL